MTCQSFSAKRCRPSTRDGQCNENQRAEFEMSSWTTGHVFAEIDCWDCAGVEVTMHPEGKSCWWFPRAGAMGLEKTMGCDLAGQLSLRGFDLVRHEGVIVERLAHKVVCTSCSFGG